MDAIANIEYFCARGHVTRVSFSATALFDVPNSYPCQTCHEDAYRNRPRVGESAASQRQESSLTTRHLTEVEARRSSAERDAILEDALRRLREGER
ncbi:RNA polymerase-binding protein RbpA [uncultured Actinomyces sp.]|uniref:RNA polymerase-binding protein RbpA n=1 Tax=uncultured Actinomyces sp. TaxID=249061 RepID=UPI0037DC278F